MRESRQVTSIARWFVALLLSLLPGALQAQCFPLPPVTPPCCAIDYTRFVTATGFTWLEPDQACPQLYDVVRGDLGALFSTKSYILSSPFCFPGEYTAAGTTADDTSIPAIGEGFWYIPRVHGATYNVPHAEQSFDRDPELLGICDP